ncbi:MAG: malto-oligosyltrehalose synthase [Candidatus Riflebacteria bacterium]|nr:malto-oligosyltrehalose synthase [Candidatus Riflebacteria bacterium]
MTPPSATYRIQLQAAFPFPALQEILPYLSELGISHIYASPIFQARAGSTHGYDVVDSNRINAELGGMEEFRHTLDLAKSHHLKWIQDIVPNHMAFHGQNSMLMDVFELGTGSEYHNVFDVDWDHTFENLRHRLLAPFLGKFYGRCLEDGELKLVSEEGTFFLTYYELKYPLSISSYSKILEPRLGVLETRLGPEDPRFTQFLGGVLYFKSLAEAGYSENLRVLVDQAKLAIRKLSDENVEISEFISETLAMINGKVGDPGSFDSLDSILFEQIYRLSYWKSAISEINYRRFFNINDLISVRVEEPKVLAETHKLILQLLHEEHIDGIRIDHIDGLYDPLSYLQILSGIAPRAFIIVEKILERHETLPTTWPAAGTSGYDFLNAVNGIFVQASNAKKFDELYEKFASRIVNPEELRLEKQKNVISFHLKGNINNLAQYMKNLASGDRFGRDITMDTLKEALIEYLTFFPVYRSYINGPQVSPRDESMILHAIDKCLKIYPDMCYEFEFIRTFFLTKDSIFKTEEKKREWLRLVMTLQQYTGPLMAKGVEDTFFYVYNRLISLNEVGGNPIEFGWEKEGFHALFLENRKEFPQSMNSTSTHDTKRGEDNRARINVLSEIPQEWNEQVQEWAKLNSSAKTILKTGPAPDGNDEYFLYQTLIGTLPFSGLNGEFIERVKKYWIKALREAKVSTNWISPSESYENASMKFLSEILKETSDNPFLKAFFPFQKKVAYFGMLNSLSQVLLKMTAPGFPDFYQGSELWELSLVDPDNRGLVDFVTRRTWLKEIRSRIESNDSRMIPELLESMEDGRVKLFLIAQVLKARKDFDPLFRSGTYNPISISGEKAECALVFSRESEGTRAITIAPRFFTQLCSEKTLPLGEPSWKNTYFPNPNPGARWKNRITGETFPPAPSLRLGEILNTFPVAFLVTE